MFATYLVVVLDPYTCGQQSKLLSTYGGPNKYVHLVRGWTSQGLGGQTQAILRLKPIYTQERPREHTV